MKFFAVLLLALVAGACTYNPHRGYNAGHAGKGDGYYDGQDKVLVCHKGKTMELPPSALDGHLGHGDHRGRC